MTEAVEVEAHDGAVLRGELRQAGSDWAVLVHDLGEDIDAWRPLHGRLVRGGMSVLALDLRGHGGSDGDIDAARTADDLAVAVAFARNRGAGRVYLAAAGESARAALEVGAAEGCEAIVLLAPVGDDLSGSPLPRLSVVSSRDARQQAAARALHRGPGWSLVASVPADASGCGLLAGRWGRNVQDYVGAFLADRRSQGKTGR
jgi:alpha-beta hydrolase superfamily lysophospholipase